MQEGEELSLRPLHTNLSSHAAYTRRARQCHGFGQGLCCGIHDESSTLCTQAIPMVQRRAITSNRRLDCTEVEIELLVLGPSLGHNKSLSSPVRATSTILISATTFYSSSHMSTVHMSHVGVSHRWKCVVLSLAAEVCSIFPLILSPGTSIPLRPYTDYHRHVFVWVSLKSLPVDSKNANVYVSMVPAPFLAHGPGLQSLLSSL